jgi:hypothetical protein
MEGITIFRIADGKIVEAWSVENTFKTAQQLGIIPQIGMVGLDTAASMIGV